MSSLALCADDLSIFHGSVFKFNDNCWFNDMRLLVCHPCLFSWRRFIEKGYRSRILHECLRLYFYW